MRFVAFFAFLCVAALLIYGMQMEGDIFNHGPKAPSYCDSAKDGSTALRACCVMLKEMAVQNPQDLEITSLTQERP